MTIIEDQRTERITRGYPRGDPESGDYLIRDGAYRGGPRDSEAQTFAVVAASSALKTAGGIVVAVLAILALVGLIPTILLPIAGIVFGVAIFAEGAGIAGEYRKLARWLAETRSERVEFAGGTGVELAVGTAAIVLGILSLVRVAPATLMPVLVIAGGAGLALAVATVHRLNDLEFASAGMSEFGQRLHHEAFAGAALAQMLCGLAALVLGILALIWSGTTATGYGPLAEIGMICLGVAAAIGGGAIAGRSTMLYRRG